MRFVQPRVNGTSWLHLSVLAWYKIYTIEVYTYALFSLCTLDAGVFNFKQQQQQTNN